MTSVDELAAESHAAPARLSPVRPFYWSVRRELWENRAVFLAPLVVAAVVLFSSLFNVGGLPRRIEKVEPGNTAQLRSVVLTPFLMPPAPIMLVTFVVAFFYSVDAFHGERRDRSILFWKSLPVSDRTTVLSKLAIPMAVLPAIALVLGWLTLVVLLVYGTVVLAVSGISPGVLWGQIGLFEQTLVMIYGLTAHVLWFAPIYGWLLLVSAWARRAPALWAFMPFFLLMALEAIVFRTSVVGSFIGYRFIGAMQEAFVTDASTGGAIIHFDQLDVAGYLTAPGLWLGLAFAAACIAAAVRLRRNREPI